LQIHLQKKMFVLVRSSVCLCIVMALVASCGPSKKGIFGDRRSEHQKYGDRLKDAGLEKSQLGSLWFIAADKSVTEPQQVSIPYKETGYFAADKPAAAGYSINARRGDRMLVAVSVVPVTVETVFIELWHAGDTPTDLELLATADSTMQIVHDVKKDGRYIVRVQPELLQGLEYTITINTGPSLAFPVSSEGNPKLISFWYDPRDGGKRSHEGVDISAKFRTPAIASADGRVNRVMENRLGGKVVFMRPNNKDYTLYYAHLDTQTVNTGDEVKTGQVLGLVGNTGNARGTVPHLHFGIYTFGGAVDPLPFIDHRRKEPEEISASTEALNEWVRTTQATKLSASPSTKTDTVFKLDRGAAALVLGATSNWYRVQLPDGRRGYIPEKLVTTKNLTTYTTDSITRILDLPIESAAAIATVNENTVLDVMGIFGSYYKVRAGENTGWVKFD